MVRIIDAKFLNNENGKWMKYIEAAGLSTDTKPTENVITGSKFIEVDTGKTYLFLPSVKIIGNSFAGASKLEEIYIGPNCTEIPAGSFGGAGTSGKTLTINCGFAEGTITTNWLVGIVATPTVNYNVPIPTITLPS